MLKTLKLSNYRQHVDRTVTFGAGINAIRGANEAGKTTVLEAWAYLFFGAKALAESLEDVVTYDTPVSKLKVEGTFTFLGVDYEAYRGKSGAEVKFGREIITGQTEVTRFFESLFNCNAAMAGKLMIAEQVQLRGALEDGPKAAGEMIEYLADFDLLDRVIELVQANLPVGVTTGVESRIALLAEQAKEVALTDVKPLEAAVTAAQAVLAEDRRILADKLADLDSLDVVAASQILADQKRLTDELAVRAAKIENLQVTVAEPLPEAPAEGAIDAVRAKIEAQKSLDHAARVHAGLKNAEQDVLWDEPRAALDEAIAQAEGRIASLSHVITEHQAAATARRKRDSDFQTSMSVELARAQARAIKETTCAFCQKDLTDVPEVVSFNAALAQEIEGLQGMLDDQLEEAAGDEANSNTALTEYVGQHADATTELNQLVAVAKVDDTWERILASAGEFITVDRSVVPARWTWTGPTDEPQDFAGELATLVAQEKAATAARGARGIQVGQLADLMIDQKNEQATLDGLPLADAQETIELANEIKPKIAALRTSVEAAADAVHLAEGALATAVMANEQGAKASKQAKAQLALAEEELAAMQANNVLVNKVRKARPVITNKLWNLTLGATSKYFTDVRGVPSVITRDGIFKCNGKPVAGLSGSAKDALGLSIRVALVKTFLPTMPFMMLDEPAAACSDERETSMLGLLSTIGFDQVILVTHSDLADAFCDHLIQL